MFKRYNEQVQIKKKQERLDIELEQAKQREDDKERGQLNERRERARLQAQKDHEDYLMEKQLQQFVKNDANSPEERMIKAQQEADENRRRWKAMYTDEEIELRKLDPNSNVATEYIEYTNLKEEGKVRDIYDYKRYKRREEQESNLRRRKLKGLS